MYNPYKDTTVFVKVNGQKEDMLVASLERNLYSLFCSGHDYTGHFRVDSDGEIVVLSPERLGLIRELATENNMTVKTEASEFICVRMDNPNFPDADTTITINVPAVLSGSVVNAKKILRMIAKNATDENIATVTYHVKAHAAESFLTWKDAVKNEDDEIYKKYGFVTPFNKEEYIKNITKKEKKAYDSAAKKLEAWNEICKKQGIDIESAVRATKAA